MSHRFNLAVEGDPSPLHEKVVRAALAKYVSYEDGLESRPKEAGWPPIAAKADFTALEESGQGLWGLKEWSGGAGSS